MTLPDLTGVKYDTTRYDRQVENIIPLTVS
jgi:hypothetical protein